MQRAQGPAWSQWAKCLLLLLLRFYGSVCVSWHPTPTSSRLLCSRASLHGTAFNALRACPSLHSSERLRDTMLRMGNKLTFLPQWEPGCAAWPWRPQTIHTLLKAQPPRFVVIPCYVTVNQFKRIYELVSPIFAFLSAGKFGHSCSVGHGGHQFGVGVWVLSSLHG